MELELPKKFEELSSNEMMYLDGGISVSRGFVSGAIDMIALSFCWYLAPIKFMGKQAARSLVSKYLSQLSGLVIKAARILFGMAINSVIGSIGQLIFNNLWCLTSIGGVIALGLDYVTDRRINNRIVF